MNRKQPVLECVVDPAIVVGRLGVTHGRPCSAAEVQVPRVLEFFGPFTRSLEGKTVD